MRVGVLGGTFDPIHLGHLLIAEEVRLRLDLQQVIFIPAGQPRLRTHEAIADGADRLRMVELATTGNPFFRACAVEVHRSGPTYTVDTLEELHRDQGPDTCLHFIVGEDILGNFHLWKDPDRVLELCRLVVVGRPGADGLETEDWSTKFPRAAARVTRLATPRIDISGTDIRKRVCRGESLRYLVPESVADYIRERGLYLTG
jgi:nicotinate-nucleotide adenylyltransferase